MKHVSILVPFGVSLTSIEGPNQAFREVNAYLETKGESPLFEVKFVGLADSITLNEGLYTINVGHNISDVSETDLIIIPALQGDLAESLEKNRAFIPWIIKNYMQGAEVASLCVGAFMLAATGLVNGKQCSTHWRAEAAFRKLFPEVNLVVEKILTDEDGIYSSGGAYSSTNLILYLVEKFAGRDVAVYCSKMFQLDIDRGSQSPFIIFNGQKEHEDEPVRKAQDYIENNYRDKISVEQLTLSAR